MAEQRKAPDAVPEDEIRRILTRYPWNSRIIATRKTGALWSTEFGFYFTVPHDCTRPELEEILKDLKAAKGKRNV